MKQLESSRLGEQQRPNAASIVREFLDAAQRLSQADREQLMHLAAEPDETIDLSDAPELSEERWKCAVRNPYLQKLHIARTRSDDGLMDGVK